MTLQKLADSAITHETHVASEVVLTLAQVRKLHQLTEALEKAVVLYPAVAGEVGVEIGGIVYSMDNRGRIEQL